MGTVSLTLHDGRKVGLPSNAAFVILNLEAFPDKDHPKAKTQILYAVDQGKIIQVRDAFKHVLSQFPLAFGNQGWSHLTDIDGRDVAIAGPSAIAYEQRKAKEFDVTFQLPTGPTTIGIRATLAEVEGLLKPDPPTPETAPAAANDKAAPAPKAKRKPAAPKVAAPKP